MGIIFIGCLNVVFFGFIMVVILIILFLLGDGIRLMELGFIFFKFVSVSDCFWLVDLDFEFDLVI